MWGAYQKNPVHRCANCAAGFSGRNIFSCDIGYS